MEAEPGDVLHIEIAPTLGRDEATPVPNVMHHQLRHQWFAAFLQQGPPCFFRLGFVLFRLPLFFFVSALLFWVAAFAFFVSAFVFFASRLFLFVSIFFAILFMAVNIFEVLTPSKKDYENAIENVTTNVPELFSTYRNHELSQTTLPEMRRNCLSQDEKHWTHGFGETTCPEMRHKS